MDFRVEEKIRELAYIMAEKEGFQGCPVGYWLAAENVVNECRLKAIAPSKAKKVAPKKPATKKR